MFPAPIVPPSRTADSYFNLLSPTPKKDAKLATTAKAVAANPKSSVSLSDLDWDLSDLGFLDALPRNLSGLMLFGGSIRKPIDLEQLARFPDLERLCVSGAVRDWHAIGAIGKLKALDLHSPASDDLAFLGGNTQLEVLNLYNCRFKSISGLSKLQGLKQLDIHAKVTDATSWHEIDTLNSLERVHIHTYSPIAMPSLRDFRQLAYLAVHAMDIEFDIDDLMSAPCLQALELDGAPYLFMASPQGPQPGAAERWERKLLKLAAAHPLTASPSLRRVFLGTLPAASRKQLAEWLHVPCVREPELLLKANFLPLYDDKLEARAEKKYASAVATIQKRMKATIGKKCRVQFAAYETDAAGLPIDNLDAIAFHGRCRFLHESVDDAADYVSEDLLDPTWLQVAMLANQMIESTNRDTDHTYLEGVRELRHDGAVAVLDFEMGS